MNRFVDQRTNNTVQWYANLARSLLQALMRKWLAQTSISHPQLPDLHNELWRGHIEMTGNGEPHTKKAQGRLLITCGHLEPLVIVRSRDRLRDCMQTGRLNTDVDPITQAIGPRSLAGRVATCVVAPRRLSTSDNLG